MRSKKKLFVYELFKLAYVSSSHLVADIIINLFHNFIAIARYIILN